MLGPDASVEQVNGQSQPLNDILAYELAQRIRPDSRKDINPSNLTEVSQYYQMEHGRNALEIFVESFYRKRQNAVSEIHQNLASLPFDFAVAASPDNLFANALKEKDKPPKISALTENKFQYNVKFKYNNSSMKEVFHAGKRMQTG